MKVLVCGGRNFNDAAKLYATLDRLHAQRPVTGLISGNGRGADLLGERWAMSKGILVSLYPANWDEQGRAAGPIRNAKMIQEGKPDLVVAFEGGRGTAHTVLLAKKCNIEVIEVM